MLTNGHDARFYLKKCLPVYPLEDSKKLEELLSNRHLREYLTRLDSSKHPAKAIEKAMKEPLFIEFADECLRVMNPENDNMNE